MGTPWLSCDHNKDIIPCGNKQALLNMMMLPGLHMTDQVNSYLIIYPLIFLFLSIAGIRK